MTHVSYESSAELARTSTSLSCIAVVMVNLLNTLLITLLRTAALNLRMIISLFTLALAFNKLAPNLGSNQVVAGLDIVAIGL